jgi:tetrahydromethanopterin S-methyltransferase subunit E
VGEEVTLEIFAVTSTILRVLRAFDFFQQIKRDIQSSQRGKVPRYGCGTFFVFVNSFYLFTVAND